MALIQTVAVERIAHIGIRVRDLEVQQRVGSSSHARVVGRSDSSHLRRDHPLTRPAAVAALNLLPGQHTNNPDRM